MRIKVANVLTMLAATLVSAILGEALGRLFVARVDYLKPELTTDPILYYRVLPGSAGHDAWGYRNRHVPRRADIVCIGDSQTYGVSAPASSSWPVQLGKMTGLEVYNL